MAEEVPAIFIRNCQRAEMDDILVNVSRVGWYCLFFPPKLIITMEKKPFLNDEVMLYSGG